MPPPVYIGDEVTAAGFRLAGLDTLVPAPGAELDALNDACARAPLVLVCAAVACRIGEPAVRRRIVDCAPPVAIIPDLAGVAPLPDIATRLRRQLGLDG
jgi:vacuolar-type H+-ATPase subunit F/Vma7